MPKKDPHLAKLEKDFNSDKKAYNEILRQYNKDNMTRGTSKSSGERYTAAQIGTYRRGLEILKKEIEDYKLKIGMFGKKFNNPFGGYAGLGAGRVVMFGRNLSNTVSVPTHIRGYPLPQVYVGRGYGQTNLAGKTPLKSIQRKRKNKNFSNILRFHRYFINGGIPQNYIWAYKNNIDIIRALENNILHGENNEIKIYGQELFDSYEDLLDIINQFPSDSELGNYISAVKTRLREIDSMIASFGANTPYVRLPPLTKPIKSQPKLNNIVVLEPIQTKPKSNIHFNKLNNFYYENILNYRPYSNDMDETLKQAWVDFTNFFIKVSELENKLLYISGDNVIKPLNKLYTAYEELSIASWNLSKISNIKKQFKRFIKLLQKREVEIYVLLNELEKQASVAASFGYLFFKPPTERQKREARLQEKYRSRQQGRSKPKKPTLRMKGGGGPGRFGVYV